MVASLQNTIEQNYPATMSSTEKTAALGRLAIAQTTANQLRSDKVLSQADSDKVLAAIADIRKSVTSTP